MAKYVKCPLCMLNYMIEGERCCKVCQNATLKENNEEKEWTLCPICNETMISSDMDMCKACERALHCLED